MYSMLRHSHSGLRWIVLILLITAIFTSFSKMSKGEASFSDGVKKIFLFNSIAFHIQTLIGLVLYFVSPKVQLVDGMMGDTALRFFGVEHISMMLIAAVLITIGYSKGKRQAAPGKYKTLFWFNLIGLILVLASIPWPFRVGLGGSWF